jgi:hypothetical protein
MPSCVSKRSIRACSGSSGPPASAASADKAALRRSPARRTDRHHTAPLGRSLTTWVVHRWLLASNTVDVPLFRSLARCTRNVTCRSFALWRDTLRKLLRDKWIEPTHNNAHCHWTPKQDRCTRTAACKEASTGALCLARWAAPAFPGRSTPSARGRTRHCPGVTPGGEAPDSGRRGEPKLVGNPGGRSASRQEVGPKPT